MRAWQRKSARACCGGWLSGNGGMYRTSPRAPMGLGSQVRASLPILRRWGPPWWACCPWHHRCLATKLDVCQVVGCSGRVGRSPAIGARRVECIGVRQDGNVKTSIADTLPRDGVALVPQSRACCGWKSCRMQVRLGACLHGVMRTGSTQWQEKWCLNPSSRTPACNARPCISLAVAC